MDIAYVDRARYEPMDTAMRHSACGAWVLGAVWFAVAEAMLREVGLMDRWSVLHVIFTLRRQAALPLAAVEVVAGVD